MHRRQLLDLLETYQPRFIEEAGFRARAIAYVGENGDVFSRHLWPAHVTGSAWVVNPSRDKVLLMHHRKLDKWFQPGGHADGEANIVAVALREAAEETGLDMSQLTLLDGQLFDLDIHTIPAIGDYPQHEHIDCRFLVELDDGLDLPGNPESWELAWVPLWQVARFNTNRSTHRMLEKTRRMRPSSPA